MISEECCLRETLNNILENSAKRKDFYAIIGIASGYNLIKGITTYKPTNILYLAMEDIAELCNCTHPYTFYTSLIVLMRLNFVSKTKYLASILWVNRLRKMMNKVWEEGRKTEENGLKFSL